MPKINGSAKDDFKKYVAKRKASETPTPKKKAMGGPSSKPAPKYDKNGNRILSGTGSVTKPPARMPDLKRPGGLLDKAVTPAKPKKATPKATPKKMSMLSKKMMGR